MKSTKQFEEEREERIQNKTEHFTRAQRRELERKSTMQSNRKRKW